MKSCDGNGNLEGECGQWLSKNSNSKIKIHRKQARFIPHVISKWKPISLDGGKKLNARLKQSTINQYLHSFTGDKVAIIKENVPQTHGLPPVEHSSSTAAVEHGNKIFSLGISHNFCLH